jgi:D-threo-aldose 1-dehydrogenase
VRHFDVAPMGSYGSEGNCLGEFFERHRAEVTVTAKYGVPAVKTPKLLEFARSFTGKSNGARAGFTAANAKESLERSLKELRVERIDVWLLHEVTADDLREDAKEERLLRLMEDCVAHGKVGMFGVASERRKVETLLLKRGKYCRTMQFEWAVTDAPVPARMQGFRIHHGAMGNHLHALLAGLIENKVRCAKWSDAVGVDLADSYILSALMLKVALMENPRSVVLFSSRSEEHVRRNVEVAGDAALEASAQRLYEVVQHEAKGLRAIEAGG